MTGRSQKVSSSVPMSQQHVKRTPTAVALRSAPRTRARTQPGSGGRDGRLRRALLRRALLLRAAGLVRGGSSEVAREPTAAARARARRPLGRRRCPPPRRPADARRGGVDGARAPPPRAPGALRRGERAARPLRRRPRRGGARPVPTRVLLRPGVAARGLPADVQQRPGEDDAPRGASPGVGPRAAAPSARRLRPRQAPKRPSQRDVRPPPRKGPRPRGPPRVPRRRRTRVVDGRTSRRR